MRRVLSVVLILILVSCQVYALGENRLYSMAGYEADTAGHVWDDNLFFRRMTEKTGVEFTFHQETSSEEWTRYKQNLLKGEDLPDVLFKAELTPQETESLYAAGILIDLKPYLETSAPNLYALLKSNPEWEKDITLNDGAIAALPQINPLTSNNLIWINATWLHRLNLDMPATAEELTEVLRAFRDQDPNRNGQKDEVPLVFTGMFDLRFLAHAFGFIGNDFYVEVNDDGQLIMDLQQDGYRDFLAWLHDMHTEKLLDSGGLTSLDSTRQITDSKATINYGIVFGPTCMSMVPSSAVSDYDVLLPLQYNGKQVYRELLGDIIRGTFAITRACENPGDLLKWVDELYAEEGCFLATTGKLGEEYELTSDGLWYWVDDLETVQSSVLKDATIAEGSATPLYMAAEYQMNFDDDSTRRTIEQVSAVKKFARLPYPLVSLTEEERKVIGEVWPRLGEWCEIRLAWFVTGEKELTDENWADFQKGMNDLGLDRVMTVLRQAMERRK